MEKVKLHTDRLDDGAPVLCGTEVISTKFLESSWEYTQAGFSEPPMKAHELLSSPEVWCQESPAEDPHGKKLQAFDPWAVKWCALGAIQKLYPSSQWGEAMDRLLRALSVSEQGLAQMSKTDKACSLMEWNDDRRTSFEEIRNILLSADI
jgi:hypothetical protein